MNDRELMQQALDALKKYHYYTLDMGHPNHSMLHEGFNAVTALQKRLAHCDRCGKKLGGEGDIHTCTPDTIGDAQDRLIAEMSAQPEQKWQYGTPLLNLFTKQPEQEPVAWLCGRSNGDTFALTVKQLRELGYGNISMPPFKKLAPLFTALAQQEMAHDRMMDDALIIGSAWSRGGERIEPTSVYTTPPAAPVQPVGMRWRWPGYAWVYTEEIRSDLAGNPEKELLYTTPPAAAQQEQEPVAWMTINAYGEEDDIHYENPEGHLMEGWTYRPLYTHPLSVQPQPVSMRMPKAGDKVICLEDESLATVVSLTAGGSPDIVFSDGSRGTYLLHEFAELFGYATPPAAPAAQRTWVGLTKADINEIWKGEPMLLPWDMTRTLAIEQRLKEKNI
jgi:hypothetical protein